jgi:hypothetical protein
MFSTTLLPFTFFHTICTTLSFNPPMLVQVPLVINGHQNIKCILVSKTISWYFTNLTYVNILRTSAFTRWKIGGKKKVCSWPCEGVPQFFFLSRYHWRLQTYHGPIKVAHCPQRKKKKKKIPLNAHPPKLINRTKLLGMVLLHILIKSLTNSTLFCL